MHLSGLPDVISIINRSCKWRSAGGDSDSGYDDSDDGGRDGRGDYESDDTIKLLI